MGGVDSNEMCVSVPNIYKLNPTIKQSVYSVYLSDISCNLTIHSQYNWVYNNVAEQLSPCYLVRCPP